MYNSNNEYQTNGVTLHPGTPQAHNSAQIRYDGLLAQSGAEHVYARVGFGSNWANEYDYRMERTASGFEATVSVQSADTLNIAFKDCADHWDNNSGKNYTFDIHR